jgi:hypothetical protein
MRIKCWINKENLASGKEIKRYNLSVKWAAPKEFFKPNMQNEAEHNTKTEKTILIGKESFVTEGI